MSDTTQVNGQTLSSKIMSFLQLGDEGKVSRFVKKYDKHIKAQIAIRNTELEEVEEQIEDLEETYNDAIFNVDMDAIKDDAKSYSESYTRTLLNFEDKLKELEEEKEAIEEAIKTFNTIKDRVANAKPRVESN